MKTNLSGNNGRYLKSLPLLYHYTEFTFKNRVGLSVSVDSNHLNGWVVAVMATFTSAVTSWCPSPIFASHPPPLFFLLYHLLFTEPACWHFINCINYCWFGFQNTATGLEICERHQLEANNAALGGKCYGSSNKQYHLCLYFCHLQSVYMKISLVKWLHVFNKGPGM